MKDSDQIIFQCETLIKSISIIFYHVVAATNCWVDSVRRWEGRPPWKEFCNFWIFARKTRLRPDQDLDQDHLGKNFKTLDSSHEKKRKKKERGEGRPPRKDFCNFWIFARKWDYLSPAYKSIRVVLFSNVCKFGSMKNLCWFYITKKIIVANLMQAMSCKCW